eukprot:9040373-Karenia_brevis.AAC.1
MTRMMMMMMMTMLLLMLMMLMMLMTPTVFIYCSAPMAVPQQPAASAREAEVEVHAGLRTSGPAVQ